ncbi:MAG: PEP-CTERM sorting domain-containing protein [Alphaproteobacteria bacterium]
MNINPSLTSWIAWNNASTVAIANPSCGVGEAYAGLCLGGAMDDFMTITITNPGGATSAFNYDRNNIQNSPIGGTFPNFVDFHQNVIFGAADSAPDSRRVNFSNGQFIRDEAGAQNTIFTSAGNYTFDFSFRNEHAPNASHGDIYLLVDSAPPPPGSTPGDPILPAGPGPGGSGYDFTFDVTPDDMVFIDPVIAIGYDYIVSSGPNIASVLLPTILNDDGQYEIYLWDGDGFDILDGVATAESDYLFDAGGVDRFRVLGIDETALLDPANATAFVTGLTFVSGGTVAMSMIPVTFDTDAGAGQNDVPEPFTLSLLGAGLAGIGALRQRRTR